MYILTLKGEVVEADDGDNDAMYMGYAQYLHMSEELDRLRKENRTLRKDIQTIELAHVLETGNTQSIEIPGDADDFLFSEN